jgi:hypothetical protein
LARRISIASVLVAVVVGIGFWLVRDPVAYSHPLSSTHKLTIRTAPGPTNNQLTLNVTYHYAPAIGTYMVAKQIVNRPNEGITFSLVVDRDNGLQCIYDNNDIGFLLLYHEPSDDLWDTTGRSGGWNGTDKVMWQQRLHELHQKFPSIPYSVLPN